jgi:hypothetical protein
VLLAELIEHFHQMLANHLSVAAFYVMTLHEVNQLAIFE